MKKILFAGVGILSIAATMLIPIQATAQGNTGGFSLQVSPSPIVETIKPGDHKTIDVKVRNTSAQTEELKMGLREFSINNDTGEVLLKDYEPKDIAEWVTFSDPLFTVKSGESFSQKVSFNVPTNAGFNYGFAVLISRAKQVVTEPGKASIQGSVAIFTLLSIDRPDAVKKIDIVSFVSKKRVYEYLPSTFNLKLKNSGNTILQPYGNIFVQRSQNSPTPISVLPVNATGSYILPDVSRSVDVKWEDGFPVYKSSQKDSGSGNQDLVWDWGTLQKFRFGHYYAKAIVVYNDGTRDVPAEAILDFWVIPWKLLILCILLLAIVIIGVITVFKKAARLTHKKDREAKK